MRSENHLPSLWWTTSWLLGLAVVSACALPAATQNVSKSFHVSPESSELEVINKKGSVMVVPGEGNVITVAARPVAGEARVEANQTSPNHIRVEVSGNGSVDFVINVPVHTTLNLLCYKCPITVKNINGQMCVRTTDWDSQHAGRGA